MPTFRTCRTVLALLCLPLIGTIASAGDPDVRRCGHGDKPTLANFDTVRVFAHSKCPAGMRRKPSNS